MYYFIINPNAKSRMGIKVWRELKSILINEHVEFREFITRKPSNAKKIAGKLSLSEKPVNIVVLGGDGTLHEVVSGIRSVKQVRLGYIPIGSGNDFARGMGWKVDPVRQLEAILYPLKQDALDYGCVKADRAEGKFMVSAGIGFDAKICHMVNHSSAKGMFNRLHLGKLTYLLKGLRTFKDAKVFQAEIELDDNRKVFVKNILFLSIHNMPYEGGGIPFCPKADPRDGKLDVCIVANIPKHKLIYLLMKALKGEHIKYRGIHMERCHKIKIQTQTPQYLHMDGEVPGKVQNAEILVSTDKLRMITASSTPRGVENSKKIVKKGKIQRGWQ